MSFRSWLGWGALIGATTVTAFLLATPPAHEDIELSLDHAGKSGAKALKESARTAQRLFETIAQNLGGLSWKPPG